MYSTRCVSVCGIYTVLDVCVCMCVYMCVIICVLYIYIFTYIYMCTCVCVCVCLHLWVQISINQQIYMSQCMPVQSFTYCLGKSLRNLGKIAKIFQDDVMWLCPPMKTKGGLSNPPKDLLHERKIPVQNLLSAAFLTAGGNLNWTS